MAEFSKQYCELHDPEFPWDFDIMKEADQLDPDHYTPIICEGFGFTAIGKDKNGNILFGIPTNETPGEIEWRSWEEIIK